MRFHRPTIDYDHRRVWPRKNKASQEVGAWIEDGYSRRRRHTSLGQVSPVDFELQYSNQNSVFAQAA
jgi:transposase InsO family protein